MFHTVCHHCPLDTLIRDCGRDPSLRSNLALHRSTTDSNYWFEAQDICAEDAAVPWAFQTKTYGVMIPECKPLADCAHSSVWSTCLVGVAKRRGAG